MKDKTNQSKNHKDKSAPLYKTKAKKAYTIIVYLRVVTEVTFYVESQLFSKNLPTARLLQGAVYLDLPIFSLKIGVAFFISGSGGGSDI